MLNLSLVILLVNKRGSKYFLSVLGYQLREKQNLPINQLEFHIQSGFTVFLKEAFKQVGMVSFPGWNIRLKEIVSFAFLAAFLG